MPASRATVSFFRRVASWAPAAIPIALGMGMILAPARISDRVRDLLFDEYQVWSPRPWSADLPVRIVAIDDNALAAVGQWPWPRDKIAELTQKIAALRPAAIGFDILFSEEDRLALPSVLRRVPPGGVRNQLEKALSARAAQDAEAFAKSIAGAPVVLSESFTDDPGVSAPPDIKANFVTLGDDPRALAPLFSRTITPLPDLARAARGIGGVNFIPERDLVVRRAPFVFSAGPPGNRALAPSFAGELLRVAQIDPADHTQASPSPIIKSTGASLERRAGGASAIISLRIGAFEIPTEADGQVRMRYAGHQPGRFISAQDVFEGRAAPGALEGRIVLVGVTAASAGDVRSTPLEGAVAGVEIHAEAIEHAASGARLERPDYARGLEALMALIGGLAAVAVARGLRPGFSALAIFALTALAGWGSWRAFAEHSLLFDPLLPGATWLAAWGGVTIAAFRHSENERRFVRSAFSRYLAPAVVERLAANPRLLHLGGESRDISVLFCDARDFTSRAESLSPEGVVRFLNGLLTPLTAQVLSRSGGIDKYLGDGLMAYWNAPVDTPDHASLACEAALAMIACIPSVDREAAEIARAAGQTHVPVVVGIGVNTGPAFVGNMGSEQRFDYSMVGDTVNVAARLEAATKVFGVPIVVSDETRRRARGFRFVPLGMVALKGRDVMARAHALHGLISDPEPDFDAFLKAHEAVLRGGLEGAGISAAIEDAFAFAQAARYQTLYRRLAAGATAPALDGDQNAGGS